MRELSQTSLMSCSYPCGYKLTDAAFPSLARKVATGWSFFKLSGPSRITGLPHQTPVVHLMSYSFLL